MKRCWLLFLVALAPLLLRAQADPSAGPAALQAQRARIAAQREQELARYDAQLRECASRFAANDCRNAVKARERETLAELRRQEVALNAEQRRVEAQDRAALAQRRASDAAVIAPAPAASGSAARGQARREAPLGAGGAKPGAQAEKESRGLQKESERQAREARAAERRSAHQRQLLQAQQHRQGLQQRLEQRNRPAAPALPPADGASRAAGTPKP